MLEEDAYMSDLTEDEGEGDDKSTQTRSPTKKKTRARKNDPSEYRIQGALTAYRATTYNAQHLFEQLNSGDVSLDAEYQRDVVWPVAKQIGLIDSVFRNFYIPPVIFSVIYESDGSEKRVCIDGKQRLTSIQKFMNGIIPHKDVYTGEKYFYKENPNRAERGKLLPLRYQKIFQNKQIVCIEYTNLTDDSEREIFQRVQLGMALTPAEKLQAVSSPSSSFVRTLVALYVHNQLEHHLDWDTARGGDFRCVASAVYCIEKEAKVVPSMSSLMKWLQEPDELDEVLCEDIHTTFKIFATLSKDSDYNRAFKLYDKKKALKVSPAEFIMIGVMIYRFKGKLTMKQLSEAIENMRWSIRESEKDIRMNSRVFKLMLNFIVKLKASQLASDPNNDVAAVDIKNTYTGESTPAGDDDELEELEDDAVDSKGKGKATTKRKRSSKNNEDDGDYSDSADYKPHKKVSTPAKSQRTPVRPGKSSPNLRRALKQSSPSPSSPPSSAPPSYSSQPSSQRGMHSDRLDAIRRAKEAQQQHAEFPASQWPVDLAGLRLGAGPMYPDIGKTLMETLGFAQALPMLQQQFPYASQNPPPPNAGGASRYANADNGYQRRPTG
ncbi:hypothetical protein PHLGIDRAFT_129517 [Phlebiopsis gigantea 11061_1 CR5-6]|uniref:EF-hand domain-containing protein n=1 Tax=Phlebiopsis gigantea (strain 11061_1 CR5-6) TaxID=745531 RepID=A0A0C3S709_PHLG1|nr:hypothetical protein PHLGIDRAFT_129517 [Phlebiopsis gigantea 11061_1 CR5-6]